jgi:ABC-type thiamin/hydroxymethylpyrimidine transport system permease subunit
MKKMTTKTSVAGAIAYAIWGLLHVQAAYAVYRVGVALEPGMVQAAFSRILGTCCFSEERRSRWP